MTPLPRVLIDLKGGFFECKSTPGVGATFAVILPVAQSHEAILGNAPKEKLILL
jgi:hypothetical protein